MNKKRIFLHVGLPKCASTSLQHSLSKCKEIDYVGFIPDKKDGLFWKDEKFAMLFDRILRFSCNNEQYWKALIDDYISHSKKNTIVFSSENISLRLLPWDIPTSLKLRFIKNVFPTNTKFIYIYKSPLDLLNSLYKEWVLMGYRGKFNEFCDELYEYKDISLFSDILLNNFLQLFEENFIKNNMNLFFLENNIVNQIEQLLNVKLENRSIKNQSINRIETEIIRSYNNNLNDYDSFFDTIEMHRAYFNLKDSDNKYNQVKKRMIRKDLTKTIKNYYNKSNPTNNNIINKEIKSLIIADLKTAKKKLENNNMFKLSHTLQKIITEISDE